MRLCHPISSSFLIVSPFVVSVDSMQLRLYAQLMMNESWREEMKDRSKEALQRSGGLSEITLDELVGKLLPHGKAGVPASIQTDCTARIRQACNIPEPEEEDLEEEDS